jgi:glycosyltransferase involved in cell wall biosynthesis
VKILLISTNSGTRGGGGQYLVYLAQGLKDLGQEVLVLLSDRPHMDFWESKFGKLRIETRRESLVSLRERPFRYLQSLRDIENIQKITAICRKINPTIIHVNQLSSGDGLDYVLGALKSEVAPVIGTIHMTLALSQLPRDPRRIKTWLITCFNIDRFKRTFLKSFYSKYSYSKIFVSEEMKKEFEVVFGMNGKSRMIYNGVYMPKVARKEASQIKVVGFCGRLDMQKDIRLLIDSWLRTGESGIRPKLLIIGDGSLRGAVEKYLRKKAPEGDWKITGWVENPAHYLNRIDLLVFTSKLEGWPLAGMEAISLGIPVLSVRFPGIEELANRTSLLNIINSREPNELAKHIQQNLLNRNLSLERNDSTSFFSHLRMAEETLMFYREVLKLP